MEAIAPAALALSVSFDAVATLGLVLMSYEGPFMKAMLPLTDDWHVNVAAGLGDILVLTVLRGCVVMLPLLGLSATLPWLATAVTAVAAMTGWLVAKAVLISQLAAGRELLVPGTDVTLHVPTLMAAEVLGVFMGWFLLILVWINRSVMRQPAAGDPIIALQARTAAALQQQQRLAVEQWVSQQQREQQGVPEITVPLLAAAEAAELEGADEVMSFVSAKSRAGSGSSWASATSLPGTSSLPGSLSLNNAVSQ